MTEPFDRILTLLGDHGVPFRVVEHEPEGRSEFISRIRGNHPSQAMKALVVTLKGGGKGTRHVLVVLPGDRRLDMRAVRKILGASSGSFASAEVATEMTECVMGAVPPFSFRNDLPVLADQSVRDNEEVVFNAGRLDRSIFMNLKDYLEVVQPQLADIAEPLRQP